MHHEKSDKNTSRVSRGRSAHVPSAFPGKAATWRLRATVAPVVPVLSLQPSPRFCKILHGQLKRAGSALGTQYWCLLHSAATNDPQLLEGGQEEGVRNG